MQTSNGAATDDFSDNGATRDRTNAPSRYEDTSDREDASDRATQSSTRRRARAATGVRREALRRRVYAQSDLSGYGWRDRLIIRVADLFFYTLLRVIGATMRCEVHGAEHLDAIHRSGRRAIFTSWHACIFGATWFWRKRGIVVMSSVSRDAEYTARFIKRFGYGTARGSATRGSHRAMAEMAECLLSGLDVGFTIDGPRGPAYQAKPGAVTLARHTGQAILPFHVAVARYWELPSWDRLQIPKPFTRAAVFVGEPITVAASAGKAEALARQAALQATLDRLRDEGDAWRARLTSS
ncbi:MAG: lysophospholipid acyltransferase family protein [Blastocatellia bacterium]